MKKVIIVLLVMTSIFMFTGCDLFNKNTEEKEVIVDTKEMKELPKIAFRELEKYINSNEIKNVAKNAGEFDIRKVNIGKNKELYLSDKSYYYVTNGNIFMYVEYIYNDEYLCKMTISDDEDNIAGFSYHLLDKEN